MTRKEFAAAATTSAVVCGPPSPSSARPYTSTTSAPSVSPHGLLGVSRQQEGHQDEGWTAPPLEGGLGKSYLGGGLILGAAYYAQWKLTEDQLTEITSFSGACGVVRPARGIGDGAVGRHEGDGATVRRRQQLSPERRWRRPGEGSPALTREFVTRLLNRHPLEVDEA